MRISVDVDEETMRDVIHLTGEKAKGPALARAVEEFVKRKKAAHFGRLIREGAFDYPDYSRDDETILNPTPPAPKT